MATKRNLFHFLITRCLTSVACRNITGQGTKSSTGINTRLRFNSHTIFFTKIDHTKVDTIQYLFYVIGHAKTSDGQEQCLLIACGRSIFIIALLGTRYQNEIVRHTIGVNCICTLPIITFFINVCSNYVKKTPEYKRSNTTNILYTL